MTVASLSLMLILVFSATSGRGATLGIEADILHPVLRVTERSMFERSWISPRFYFRDQFHIGVDLIYDASDITGFSVGNEIGHLSASTYYQGLSLGYYFSGYRQSSFKLIAGGGSAKRRFKDTLLGSTDSSGTFYYAEAGYQFSLGAGLWGLSLVSLNSNLLDEVSYTAGANQSGIRKKNDVTLLKVTIGILF